jgi:Gram-negative bacterial TonB protein C-terminal
MRRMGAYPRAAMERAMKVQDVMLQAMAKKITWWQAAEILGISDRHMRRWRDRKKLFDSAIKAVQQWVYKPYLLNGEPVDVETDIRVTFKLQ